MRRALLLCLALASPVTAQSPGSVYRAPLRQVRVDSATASTVFYHVLESEATPSTVCSPARCPRYSAGKASFLASFVFVSAPAPPPPDTTPPIPDTLPPTAGAVFSSDFRTGTVLDGKWTSIAGNGRLNEVVPSTGLDFPTANVLKVVAGARGDGGAEAQTLRLSNTLPVPAISQGLYYRWYFRLVIPDSFSGDGNTHPIQDAGPSSQNWLFRLATASNSTYGAAFAVSGSWPNNRYGVTLQKHTTYRVELHLYRISTTHFNLHARVYNSAGVLLFDDDDFRNINGSGSLANTPSIAFVNVAYLNGLTAGFNGLASGTGYPVTLYYQGGFCVRVDTWCGPYRDGI